VFYVVAPVWFIGTSIAINRRMKAALNQTHADHHEMPARGDEYAAARQ